MWIVKLLPYHRKVWWRECSKFTLSSIWGKKFGKWIDQPKGLLIIVTTTLDGFSLANHRQFTKFTKFSTCQTLIYIQYSKEDLFMSRFLPKVKYLANHTADIIYIPHLLHLIWTPEFDFNYRNPMDQLCWTRTMQIYAVEHYFLIFLYDTRVSCYNTTVP